MNQLRDVQAKLKKISIELSSDEPSIDKEQFFDIRKRLEHVEDLIDGENTAPPAITVNEAHAFNMMHNGAGC